MNMLETAILFRRWRSELNKASNRLYLKWHKEAPPVRLPDFLIIGAMKSGTTALHQCLAQHPDIFMTYIKEPSYFLDESTWLQQNPHVGSSERMHKLMFKGYRQQKRVGESSTTYSEAPTLGAEAPANIYRDAPGMQFIYIVRNPFERIVSHYQHCVERGIYSKPMAEVLKRDSTFLERSLYHSQIKRYLEYFEKERFLILFFEDFVKDPIPALLKACLFLGVPEELATTINTKQRNKTLVSSAVRDDNSRFDRASYEALIGPILDDVRALGEFIGRDIDHWDLSETRWCCAD
jgi:hypothetical protein